MTVIKSIRLPDVNARDVWRAEDRIMPIIETMKRIARNWANRHAARRSLGALLAKPDDHLIRDIGLSRAEVERMREMPEASKGPPPAVSLRKTQ